MINGKSSLLNTPLTIQLPLATSEKKILCETKIILNFKIQSEEVISRLENILRKGKTNSELNDFKPMSIEEFNLRIDKSMNDSENGKLIEASELKAKIEQWS